MKTASHIALCSLLLTPLTCANGGEEDDATYRALVQRVKSGDFGVDFRLLRLACVRSTLCEAPATTPDLVAMNEAGRAEDLKKEVELANKILERGYANAEVHATLAGIYPKLNEPEKATFHLAIVTGLLKSIFTRGDGKTKETAFEVISHREEYFVLAMLQLPYGGHDVISEHEFEEGSHRFARWEIIDPKTDKPVVVFFNLDQYASKSRSGAGQ